MSRDDDHLLRSVVEGSDGEPVVNDTDGGYFDGELTGGGVS